MRTNLDMDVLRTFATGMDLGSFAKAAERLGRSPSAVSAQLRKLEEQAGTAIFRKSGRTLGLTEAGETMLSFAHRLLQLNDDAVSAVSGLDIEGWVRLGMQEDFGESVLPAVLGRFRRAHPRARIEARIDRNADLLAGVTDGRLDLALAWQTGPLPRHGRLVAELPMIWVGSNDEGLWSPDEPLPLASLVPPCLMRSAAIEALDTAGQPWRASFVSPSLAGFWAAVAAGLGVGVRTPAGLPSMVRRLPEGAGGLPPLPQLRLGLYQGEATLPPLAARLADLIQEAVEQSLGKAAPAPSLS